VILEIFLSLTDQSMLVHILIAYFRNKMFFQAFVFKWYFNFKWPWIQRWV